jgi:hypothetical protein
VIDSYSKAAKEVATVLNLFRVVSTPSLPFPLLSYPLFSFHPTFPFFHSQSLTLILVQLSSFVVLFYNARLNEAVDFGWAFGIQAIISAMFGFGGLAAVVGWGGGWRAGGCLNGV